MTITWNHMESHGWRMIKILDEKSSGCLMEDHKDVISRWKTERNIEASRNKRIKEQLKG